MFGDEELEARKMSDMDVLLHINRKIKRIKEEFDIATEKEFMKYEGVFPEIVKKFQESRKCKDKRKKLKLSLEILEMSYQLRQRNCK